VRERNTLSVLASGLSQDRAIDALPLRADARLLAGILEAGRSLTHELAAGRDMYLVPSAGQILVNGMQVDEGDGVAVSKETRIEITALRDTELVVVELA
jgi:redox-sensitive bicupin YhaK (pirin superfamily)